MTREEKIRRIQSIGDNHVNDNEQTAFLDYDNSCIITAPAGCGKTATLVSKIEKLILEGKVPNPKKILVLTLSNVARYTIEHRLRKNMPNYKDHVSIHNFHTLSARILSIHGKYYSTPIHYAYSYVHYNSNLNKESFDSKLLNREFLTIHHDENETILNLPTDASISYDQVCLLAILLLEYGNKKDIYQKLYSHIIIDEFQDVTWIQWYLIRALYNPDRNKIIFAGDTFQSIMGFAGALSGGIIAKISTELGDTHQIEFQNNHRLTNALEITNFQRFIREENPNWNYGEQDYFTISQYQDFEEESTALTNKIADILSTNSKAKIAILCAGKNYFYEKENKYSRDSPYIYNKYGDMIVDQLVSLGNANFIDTLMLEKESIRWLYDKIIEFCTEYNSRKQKLTFTILKRYLESQNYQGQSKIQLDNFISLLKGFSEFCKQNEVPFKYIKEVLEQDTLIQYISYSPNINVVISNIHKAKGAEWDYIFVPLLCKNMFPTGFNVTSTTRSITNNTITTRIERIWCSRCEKECNTRNIALNSEENQLFYVAITRPRKELHISTNINMTPSCLYYHINRIV